MIVTETIKDVPEIPQANYEDDVKGLHQGEKQTVAFKIMEQKEENTPTTKRHDELRSSTESQLDKGDDDTDKKSCDHLFNNKVRID